MDHNLGQFNTLQFLIKYFYSIIYIIKLRSMPRNCQLAKGPVNCFAYSFYIVLGHRTAWRLMLLQDTSCFFETLVPTPYRSVNWCCCFGYT